MTDRPANNRVHKSARRVLILSNPTAGARPGDDQVLQLQEVLERRGCEVEMLASLEEAKQRATELAETRELRAAVAAGGDGTAAALVNQTPAGTPIALLPQGTENLLSKYIGQRRTPHAVADTIIHGNIARLDTGLANGRMFVLMIGAGFDAEVVRRAELLRNGNITHLSYAKPIWQTIRNYDYPEIRVYNCDNGQANGEPWVVGRWFFGFNLPQYARGLRIAPDASGDDGLLDVCTFRRGSFVAGLQYLTAIALRRHARDGLCTLGRCHRVRLESDQSVPYQIDGDAGGILPVEIEVLRQRLTLMVPPEFPLSRLNASKTSTRSQT